MSEYVDKFTSLVDQLKSYNPKPDLLSYTTRFIDGLRDDIRAVVLVARPTSLDAMYTLALLQEEAADPSRRKESSKSATPYWSKVTTGRGTFQLPPPPVRPVGDRAAQEDKALHIKTAAADDKFSTLKSFRRARGLCIRCGGKWAPGHRCAPTPQLHTLQEVWALCQEDFDLPEEEEHPTEPEEAVQVYMALSVSSTTPAHRPHTIQFSGLIAGRPVLILVDSGSSHSFINSDIAASLPGIKSLQHQCLFVWQMVLRCLASQSCLIWNGKFRVTVSIQHFGFCNWAPMI